MIDAENLTRKFGELTAVDILLSMLKKVKFLAFLAQMVQAKQLP
jgi:hypothetical protein